MKKITFLFCCFLINVSAKTQDITKIILVDGLQRTYIVHLPPAFNTEKKLPLIFALHGGGGTAKGAIEVYNLEPLADKNNFIIADLSNIPLETMPKYDFISDIDMILLGENMTRYEVPFSALLLRNNLLHIIYTSTLCQ